MTLADRATTVAQTDPNGAPRTTEGTHAEARSAVASTGASPRAAKAAETPTEAAKRPPLGSTQSKCTGTPDEGVAEDRRRVRFAARAGLWQASTLYPVRTCGRHLAPVLDRSDGHVQPIERHAVEVRRRTDKDRGSVAGYGGLTYCGNVWACPRCSGVVAAERSAQIAGAVAECHQRGGQVHFVTLTLRHRSGDRLEDLFPILHEGWRAVTGSTAWTGDRDRLGDRDRFGVAGFVRVIEATVSRPGSGGHGWHIHIHCLVFTMGSLSVGLRPDWRERMSETLGHPVKVDAEWLARIAFHCRIADRWIRGVTKAGGRVPGAAAVDVRTIDDGGAEYVGRYLAKSTYDVATRLGAEVAAGDLTKTSREAANVTPFGLLAELVTDGPEFGIQTPRRWEVTDTLESVDLTTGEVTTSVQEGVLWVHDLDDWEDPNDAWQPITPPGAWALWVEWEQATKRRRQLAWALRPKKATTDRERFWVALLDARGADAEAEDSDLAAREVGGITLGGITREAWYSRLVWRPSWLVDALEAAERGADDVGTWMEAHGIDYDPR